MWKLKLEGVVDIIGIFVDKEEVEGLWCLMFLVIVFEDRFDKCF